MRTPLLVLASLALSACGGDANDLDAGADGGAALDAGARDASAGDASAADSGTDASTQEDAGAASCEGTERPDVGTAVQLARDVVVARDGTIYFTQLGGAGRRTPEGSLDTSWSTIAGVSTVTGVALDAANENIFLTVPQPDNPENPSIYRIDAASAEATPIVNGGFPYAPAVGPDGMLYYGDVGAGHVFRVGPDGGTPMQVTTSPISSPRGVAFEASGTLLAASASPGSIVRLTLSAGVETDRDDLGSFPTPDAIALDASGRIYVTSEFGGILARMNADGSDLVTLQSGLSAPAGLDFGHGTLCRSDLFFVAGGLIRRFENDAPGADVLWQ